MVILVAKNEKEVEMQIRRAPLVQQFSLRLRQNADLLYAPLTKLVGAVTSLHQETTLLKHISGRLQRDFSPDSIKLKRVNKQVDEQRKLEKERSGRVRLADKNWRDGKSENQTKVNNLLQQARSSRNEVMGNLNC